MVLYGLVWFRGQMTSEFIHEEISIMEYNDHMAIQRCVRR